MSFCCPLVLAFNTQAIKYEFDLDLLSGVDVDQVIPPSGNNIGISSLEFFTSKMKFVVSMPVVFVNKGQTPIRTISFSSIPSTQLMVIMEVFHSSSRRSISPLENFKQVTSINGEHSHIYFYCNLKCCGSQCWVQTQYIELQLHPFMTHGQGRNTILSWLPIVTIFQKLIDE